MGAMSSSEWDVRYADSDLVWSAEPNMWVEALCAPLEPGRVLDLAGGEGRNALWLAERGWRATVVDFSEVALSRAQALAVERLAPERAAEFGTVQADLTSFEPEPLGYDLVLVVYLQVPEHVRRLVLRRAAEAVAVGGRLLVVAHDSSNLTDGVGGPQNPAVLYSPQDVEADLHGTGLTMMRSEQALRPVRTAESTRNAVDAVVVARRPQP